MILNGGAALKAMNDDLRASILSEIEKKVREIVPDVVRDLPPR